MIRPVQLDDAASICDIYNYYINNTVVTFEETPVSPQDMEQRIIETNSEQLPWLVAHENGEVLGYAYASKWKGRCAYRYSVEVTVYLAPSVTSKGLGTKLYTTLFSMLKQLSIHTAIGGISLPNDASIALHKKLGMEKVACFREVGFKFGKWVDVSYWQVIL
jgi:phosphinothricin acetyltransferase